MLRSNTPSNPVELSYYRLLLLSYLKDSHPDKVHDDSFIAGRGDMAAESYSEAIQSGLDHVQAAEIANEVLFKGLHFSPYLLIVEILSNEFANEVPARFVHETARLLLPVCTPVLEKYSFHDEFDGSPEYRACYTELTGFITTL